MQCQSKSLSSRAWTTPGWRATAVAMLLSLAAGPVQASNDASRARAPGTDVAGGATALQRDPVDLRELDGRVVGLEQRIDRLGVAGPSPAPTTAELERTKQEAERQAEFQKQVWTMP